MKSLAVRLTATLVACLLTVALAQAQDGHIPAQQEAFINDLAGKTEMVQVDCPQAMLASIHKSLQGYEGAICFNYDLPFSMLKAQFALYDNDSGARVYGVRDPPYGAVTPWRNASKDNYARVYMWINPPMGLLVFVHLPLVMFNVYNSN